LKDTLIKIKINISITHVLLLFLLVNPKLIKYYFGPEEEAIYIPMLILYSSTLINFIYTNKLKYLYQINFLTMLLIFTRTSAIPLLLFYFYFNYKYFKNLKKIKFLLVFIMLATLPFILNDTFKKKYNKYENNNNYLAFHFLSSNIAISDVRIEKNSKVNLLINKKIDRKKEIESRLIDNFENYLFYRCVILPALNNIIYNDIDMRNIFINNDPRREIYESYLKHFLKNPQNFVAHYFKCFYGNFYFAEFLSKQNYEKNLNYTNGKFLMVNEKNIINSFNKNSQNYFYIIEYLKFFNTIFFIVILYSIIASFFYIFRGNDINKIKIAKINIAFFLIYFLIIMIHVNIIHVQTRWFLTYFPLSILSCIFFIKQVTFYIEKRLDRIVK
tara:strand:- start:378 stop:1535 length:1158 start_codon:yes stop_codon:yes gene_type:complete